MYETLETKRLNFRFFNEEDLPFMEELLGNDDVCKYLPGNKGYRPDVIKRILEYYIETTKRYRYQHIYLVSEKENNKPIGYAGIQIVKEFDKYEIFYGFIPEAWNKGYATEASLKMKELAKEIGLEEVIALADISNIGSNRVLEKTGYNFVEKIHLWDLDLNFYTMNI